MGFIGTIVLGIIGYIIMTGVVRLPGYGMQANFQNLGTLTGKSLNEITSACGSPSSVSAMGDVNTDNLVHAARRLSARFPVIECTTFAV